MPEFTLPFTGRYGYVEGEVCILAVSTAPIKKFRFKIDTASSLTYLFDEDFILLCETLGCPYRECPDVINWIHLHPNLFTKEKKPRVSPGGILEHVFRIEQSYLRLLDSAGNPPQGWAYHSTLWGTFSTLFLSSPKNEGKDKNEDENKVYPTSHISLLGVDKLNELRRFVWAYPHNRITLTC